MLSSALMVKSVQAAKAMWKVDNRRAAALILSLFVAMPLVPTSYAVGPLDFAAPAKDGSEMIEGDFGEKWAEGQVELPPAPEAANLVPVYVGEETANKFYIDERSLSVGKDRVVRFTLVAISPSGARSISYEGLRCGTGERRLYAFGRSDGSWATARNGRWVPISDNNLNRHHAALYKEYFCTTGGSVVNTGQARDVLLRGNPAMERR